MENCPFVPGESALALPLGEAEAVVSSWRARYDSSAPYGIPAHITVLYPFLDSSRLSDPVLGELRRDFAETAPLELCFAATRRFKGVLYLAPEPVAGLLELIGRLTRRWPETPPYGGQHAQVVPHLTVAEGADEVLDDVACQVETGLPLRARLDMACLYVFAGERFELRAEFPLGTDPPRGG